MSIRRASHVLITCCDDGMNEICDWSSDTELRPARNLLCQSRPLVAATPQGDHQIWKQMILDIFFLSTVEVYNKSFNAFERTYGYRTTDRLHRRVRSIRSFCSRDVLE